MCLRHDPECPGSAPVTDRWQAASYASTRIFLPSLPSHTPPTSASTTPCSGRSLCVRDAEGRFEPGGVQRANAFGQEDGVPVGQGGVGQVAGWASAAPVEGDVGGHARGERVEVGVGARAFDAHDLVEGARIRERATPRVHVCGRVGDVHGFVASGDAGEDVDLAADFRADEAGGQADAPLTVADEGHLQRSRLACAPLLAPMRAPW